MPTDHERALSQKERELRLVLALDRIRDSFHDDEDPQGMFEAIVLLLKNELQADACAITLVAETSDDIDLVAGLGLPDDLIPDLCQRAMRQDGVHLIPDTPWPHVVGVQVILHDFPMAGLVIARTSPPFSDDEFSLLQQVETQLDSAVTQARTVWKLTQRNRELEAIYEIDRLRDHITSEADLISGFTAVMLKHFESDLCLVLLTQPDSGEMMIRGLIDRHDLPSSALDQIREYVRQIAIPQVIPSPASAQKLVILAAPFVVAGARLGAAVVGRESEFSIGDHRLLHAMMTQMDSAVVHVRLLYQLSLRNKELETIYRIDRIRDREKDFDTMLQGVLTELCDAVSSETGYVMLYNQGQDEQEMELRSFTRDELITSPGYMEIVQRVSRQALKDGKLVFSNLPEGPVRSYIAVPLILNDRIIGVFGVVNSTDAHGFGPEDRRVISAITSQVDTAIFERLEQRRMRALLSRSVDPKVLEHMLQQANTSLLSGERVILSVVFADLRGSTEWAEHTDPEELVATLNAYLGAMTEVIFKHGGTLDKFVGDEVIGLFGTPVPMEDHAYHAAAAALEMQMVHKELQTKFALEGRHLPDMGIGVSSGEAIAGEFGLPVRSEFTALGRIINLGARLCSAAEGDQALISQATYIMIQQFARVNPMGAIEFKGISQPAPVYELVSLAGQVHA